MLLIYTFDTAFHDHDLAAPLSVVTLGLSPTQATHVVTTASAVLMDTRNGFIYGVAEASEKRNGLATASACLMETRNGLIYGVAEASQKPNRLATAWNPTSALDQSRKQTESAA